MSLSTARLREVWAPPCGNAMERAELVQDVFVTVDKRTVSAVKALGRCCEWAKYNVRSRDTGAFNCRKITGGSGYSLHAYGIAVDINWNTNPYRADNVLVTDIPASLIGAITAIRTLGGEPIWRWGGHYVSVKDAMHFEIMVSPGSLASGVDWNSVRQATAEEIMKAPWEGKVLPLLKHGDRGPAVQVLHRLLNVVPPTNSGYGIFGPKTLAFVKAFQASRGLTVDGVVGRQTWTAILSMQPLVAADEPGPVKRLISQ